jgi:hypothetical protein
VDDVIKPASPPQLVTGPAADHLPVVRALARVMDSAFTIPGTRVRVGLDPLLGLLPGIGDAIASAIGGYIVLVAAHLGVSRVVLARMTMNLAADALIGVVPFVGDALDVAFKANKKNVELLERALAEPKAARRSSVWALLGLGLVLLAIAAGGVLLSVWLVQRLRGQA